MLAQVEFANRLELEKLDQTATRLGGVRASAEFRHITAYVHKEIAKPHTAVYLFTTEISRDIFVARCKRV